MPQYNYEQLSQMLADASKGMGGGQAAMTPEQIEAMYPTAKPKAGGLKETAKAIGRGVLGIPKLATNVAQGGALDLGALAGITPEQNAVAQAIQQGTQGIENLQQGETLAPNAEYAQEHPVMNAINKGFIEGGIPWLGAGALSRIPVVGKYALPAAAALSAQAEGTNRLMNQGMAGNEALATSTPGALAEGGAFALMHPAMKYLKGAVGPAGEVTRGALPGFLGQPGGVVKGALQGAVADAPFLAAQGELKQGVDVAAGAMTPEEWRAQHTPEALIQGGLSSLAGGMGFGALGAIGQKRRMEQTPAQPVVDTHTAVDMIPTMTHPPTSSIPESRWNQPELPLPGVKKTAAKPMLQDILPEGEGVFEYGEGMKLANQIKKNFGLKPEVTPLGLDVTGARRIRVAVRPEEANKYYSTIAPEEQGVFDFNQEDQTMSPAAPITTREVPLATQSVAPLATQESFDLTGKANPAPIKQSIIPPPALPSAPTTIRRPVAPVAEAPVIPSETPKVETKGKATPKVKEQATEAPAPTEGRDLQADLEDYITNPKSEVDIEPIAKELGQPVEILKEARRNHLGEQVEPAVSTKPKVTAMVNTKGERIVKTQKMRTSQEKVELPSGADVPIEQATAQAKKYAASTMGYEDTTYAKDLFKALAIHKRLTHKDMVDIWNANKDSYGITDAEKIGKGKDQARQQKAYQDRSIETLYKALQDGRIDAHVKGDVSEHAFVAPEGISAKELGQWYQDNIQGKKVSKSSGVVAENAKAPKEEGEISITKADVARMRRAENARTELTANAQRPHTVYKERIDSFKRELKRIDGEIAKLTQGSEKNALRKSYNRVVEKLKAHIDEGVEARLEKEAKPLYDKLNKMVAEVKKNVTPEKMDTVVKNMKRDNPKAVEILGRIEELKKEARETGRLDVEDLRWPGEEGDPLKQTIALFREKIEHAKKAMPVEIHAPQEEVERAAAEVSAESKLVKKIYKESPKYGEMIDHEEAVVKMMDADTRKQYENLTLDKATELRKFAKEAQRLERKMTTLEKLDFLEKIEDENKGKFLWEYVEKLYKQENVKIRSFSDKLKETEATLPREEAKTAKEIEAETNPKLIKARAEEQARAEALKEKQTAKADKEAKKLGQETTAEAEARKESERKEVERVAEQQRKDAEQAEYERQRLAANIKFESKEQGNVFKFKQNKKGEFVTKAGEEYTKFEASKKRVGSSGSISEGVNKFVSHIADKFNISSRIFITTVDDIEHSNIKDVSDIAKGLYSLNGKYMGVYCRKNDMLFIALNDKYIKDTPHLLTTVSHELGHTIMEEHYDNASPETQNAIRMDYSKWLDKLEQGDKSALDELYQDSGKNWEDFKAEYKEHIEDQTKQGFIAKSSLFNEYVAEQAAKYLKATESTPTGILGRFFHAIAEKLRYIFQYANKEFAKNRMPIQSVEKWMNDLVASKRVDVKTSKAKESVMRKTQVDKAENEFVRGFKEVFHADKNNTLADRLTNLVDVNLRDKGIIKQAVNGVLRTPYWRAAVREATNIFAKSLEATSSMKHFFKGELGGEYSSEKAGERPHVLKDIAHAYGSLPKSERELMNKLLIEGDKLGKEWTSKKDIQSETFQHISDDAFKVYKDSREFINQAWTRISNQFAETQAHTLTDNVDLRVAIKEALMDKNIQTKEQLEESLNTHRDVKRTGLDNILSEGEKQTLLETIMDEDGIKSQYKDFTRNYGEEGLTGYIPRERLEGAEWTVSLKKINSAGDETPVFNQAFYTKAEADRVARDLQANPEKYLPHNFLSMKEGESLAFDKVKPERIQERDRFGYKDEEIIANKVASALEGVDITADNKQAVINNVRNEINKQLLAQHGKQHIIHRKKTLIEGYNEDSPLDAFETVLNRTAYSFAKMRYISDQANLLANAEREKKPEIKEYINQTLKPVGVGGAQAQKMKNAAAIYFMGFRPLTAIMQLAQLHTVGAAELGMHLKQAGIKAPAQLLLMKAGKDVMTKNLSKLEEAVLQRADDLGVTFEHSSQAALFRGVDDKNVRSNFGKRLLKVSDAGMWMFQQAETYNRRAGILASYRIFSKGSDKFNQEAFDKAVEYNNNTNFMMNKGNIPYFMMHNPIGMTAYTLMSYTLNMTNWLMNRAHGSLSDTHIDAATQRQAFLKLLGYTAVLGGAAGLPFSDDLNKAIRKIFGRDLKQETISFIKKNSNEDIANLISSGIFSVGPTGVNITNNMNVRVPFLSGLLDDKSALDSVSGASGALLTKVADTATGLYHGQYRKAAEAAAPEALAGALRAERLYREGQRNTAGQPVYYEGKQIKLSAGEALAQGLFGLKSQRRAEMMQTADAEAKLQKYWQNEKKIAESKFQHGDIGAVQEYNRRLLKDKNARLLVTPIKSTALQPQKPNKGKTAYEIQ